MENLWIITRQAVCPCLPRHCHEAPNYEECKEHDMMNVAYNNVPVCKWQMCLEPEPSWEESEAYFCRHPRAMAEANNQEGGG